MHFIVFSGGQSQICIKKAWNRAVFQKKKKNQYNTQIFFVHANMSIINHKEFLNSNAFFKKHCIHPKLHCPALSIYLHSLTSPHVNVLLDIVISQVPIAVCIQHLPGTEQDAKGPLRMHPLHTALPEPAHRGLRMLRGPRFKHMSAQLMGSEHLLPIMDWFSLG